MAKNNKSFNKGKKLQNIVTYFLIAFKRYKDDLADTLSSHIALNLLLSFFPIMIFLLTVSAYSPIDANQALSVILDFVPGEAHTLMSKTLTQILDYKHPALLSISLITTLYSASRGFKSILIGLNIAYDAKEKRGFIKLNLLAILYTVGLVLLILVSLVLLVLGQTIWDFVENLLNLPSYVFIIWTLIRFAGMFILLYIAFSVLYAKSSALKLKFRQVRAGSILATLGWFVVSYIFSFYVDNFSNYSNIYGGIAGIFIMIIWLDFISSLILFGGELNAAFYYKDTKQRSRLR